MLNLLPDREISLKAYAQLVTAQIIRHTQKLNPSHDGHAVGSSSVHTMYGSDHSHLSR